MSAGTPSSDELAAIAAALDAVTRSGNREGVPSIPASAWVLAMRRPDLEFDDLLAIRQLCSIRS
jgi:hypothetical protein